MPLPELYSLATPAAQLQVAKSNSDTPVKIPILHTEFEPNLVNRVETSLRPSPTLPVALQLHEQTNVHLNIPKPMAHPCCQPQFCHTTASLEVVTQAIADTGAQMDILGLGTLSSLGIDPMTLIKVQVRVVQVSQLDIKGGIFLAVRSPDPSKYRKAVRLFYVAGNVSQNYLSCACFQAHVVVGRDFPKIGAASSSALRPFLPSTNALRDAHSLYRTNTATYAPPKLDRKTP